MFVRLWIAFFLAVAFAACAPSRGAFEPRPGDAETARGFDAARYELTTDRGRWGEARVWSKGIVEAPDDQAALHVGFRVFNDSAEPIALNPARAHAQLILRDGGSVALTAPAEAADEIIVPPDGDRRIDVRIPIGDSEIRPRHVRAYRIIWSIERGKRSYTQATTFVRDDETGEGRYYDPASYPAHRAYYEPYGPPPGPHLRFGVGITID